MQAESVDWRSTASEGERVARRLSLEDSDAAEVVGCGEGDGDRKCWQRLVEQLRAHLWNVCCWSWNRNHGKTQIIVIVYNRDLHGPDFVGPARPVDLTARPGPRARIRV